VLGGVAVLGLGAFGVARWFNPWARVGDDSLTAPQALAQVRAGAVTLIDLRRPDEWARSGVPEGAIPLDMRRADFIAALAAQLGGRDRPVALICARGVRSRRVAAQLAEAGFSRVLDVREGMLGSGAGPGWVARGLPVTQP